MKIAIEEREKDKADNNIEVMRVISMEEEDRDAREEVVFEDRLVERSNHNETSESKDDLLTIQSPETILDSNIYPATLTEREEEKKADEENQLRNQSSEEQENLLIKKMEYRLVVIFLINVILGIILIILNSIE